MSRLTAEWTDTLDEAFGATGTEGRRGEEFLMKVFESWGWETKRYESDREKQIDGIDIEFKKPDWYKFYSCDVKANMKPKNGYFEVHKDWLFRVKCDRIFHVCRESGWIVWYPVDEMRKVYDNAQEKMQFTARTRLPFMKATKVDLNAK